MNKAFIRLEPATIELPIHLMYLQDHIVYANRSYAAT
jgi:hypothetical protein